MRVEGLVGGLVAALFLSLPLVAGADPPMPAREPLRQVDRPLTHVQGTLNVYAGADRFVFADVAEDGSLSQGSKAWQLHAGIEVGVLDDLTVGALVLPLLLDPETQYGNPSVYGRFRFLRGNVEVAGSLELTPPVLANSDLSLGFGVPVFIHAGRHVRLETGGFLTLSFGDETTARISVPLSVSINPIDRLLLAARTGLSFPTKDLDGLEIPLGFAAGYTLGDPEAPFVDLWVLFAWPLFLTPGQDEATHADIWQLGLLADVYFDLGS